MLKKIVSATCSARRRRPMRCLEILSATALILAMAPGGAAEELRELGEAFVFEAQLLDLDIEDYGTAREREREAVGELQQLNRRLDEALADPNVSPAALIRMNSESAALRGAACERSRQTEEARQGLFERMQRLQALVQEAERQGVEMVGESGAVGGMWKLEAPSIEVYGLMSLKQDGTLVAGSYRLSNGRRGSVQGFFAGERLELELIDSARGKIGTIEGELRGGEIQGRWQTLELAAGRPAVGEWTAVRVSLEGILGL